MKRHPLSTQYEVTHCGLQGCKLRNTLRRPILSRSEPYESFLLTQLQVATQMLESRHYTLWAQCEVPHCGLQDCKLKNIFERFLDKFATLRKLLCDPKFEPEPRCWNRGIIPYGLTVQFGWMNIYDRLVQQTSTPCLLHQLKLWCWNIVVWAQRRGLGQEGGRLIEIFNSIWLTNRESISSVRIEW